MSDRVERASELLRRAQQTTSPEWAGAHALVALALIVKKYLEREDGQTRVRNWQGEEIGR